MFRRIHIKRVPLAIVALVMLAALVGIAGVVAHQASAAASTFSSQTTISQAGQTIPYQADPSGACYGEDINLTSGNVLVKAHGTMNDNGMHGTFDVIRQGIQGVGAQTGAQYEVVGTDTGSQNVDGVFQTTFNDHINIVGQGPDNNAVLSSTIELTVNANGDITSAVQHYSVTCH